MVVQMDIYDLMKQVNDAFNQRYCFSSKRKNSKRYGFTILDNPSLPTCPLREEKSFSQRDFFIFRDIRKLQYKSETSYTLIKEEAEVLI